MEPLSRKDASTTVPESTSAECWSRDVLHVVRRLGAHQAVRVAIPVASLTEFFTALADRHVRFQAAIWRFGPTEAIVDLEPFDGGA